MWVPGILRFDDEIFFEKIFFSVLGVPLRCARRRGFGRSAKTKNGGALTHGAAITSVISPKTRE